MPDRYGDDYQPPGARLDIGGLPVCDHTHPQCCADVAVYRENRDRAATRKPIRKAAS